MTLADFSDRFKYMHPQLVVAFKLCLIKKLVAGGLVGESAVIE